MQALANGSVTLSCGCRYHAEMGFLDHLHVRYRTESCDPVEGIENAVAYAVYCPDCKEALEKEGLLISTDAEEREWLDGDRRSAALG